MLERCAAGAVRIWTPRRGVREVLLELDALAGDQPLVDGLARCLVVRDGDRGEAVFTWRPTPGEGTVELRGYYQPGRLPQGCRGLPRSSLAGR